ncbi:MAG: wax ester/triacylglycerol synthase family O-acyltransferase, partial [Chloroflexota bacterium]
MEALTGLDASFLYLETPTTHMHVGGVSIVEGSMAFNAFRDLVASRIHLVPKLRQRLVEVPLSIDYPYWVDDPNFNINLHLQHIALPSPGGWREMRRLASSIFSKPLDRSRPLWEFTFVEGIDTINQVPSGSVAIISKIHHAAIDGVAGTDIMALLFDMYPNPKEIPDPQPFNPEPMPNEIEMVAKSTFNFMTKPLKLPQLISDTVNATIKTGFLTRAQGVDLPTVPFTAPATRLNKIISAERKWNTAILSLDRVKALKRIMDVTVNDVVLAICAGALRRYLNEKEELPPKPLVAMVPISTRDKGGEEGGNRLSMMFVQLATDIDNHIDRLKKISENTNRGKIYQQAVGAKMLSNLAETVPFGLANQAIRLYSRLQIAQSHAPMFNVVITNVPGPQFPIYLNGHKLIQQMGGAPIVDGMGLIITVFSYNGQMTISPTSDANSMPDLNIFTRYLRESANQLESEILELEKEIEKEKATPNVLESDAAFNAINQYFQENPDFLRPGAGIFEFRITEPAKRAYTLNLNDAPGSVIAGVPDAADASFKIKDEHFMRILAGDLDFQTAFVQGRLQVSGDFEKAIKVGAILSKI